MCSITDAANLLTSSVVSVLGRLRPSPAMCLIAWEVRGAGLTGAVGFLGIDAKVTASDYVRNPSPVLRAIMWRMALHPKPHSPEWFAALEAFDPRQAIQTRTILQRTGRSDVCSVCGDDPAKDYKRVGGGIPVNAVATIRLCIDCRNIRSMQGEQYSALNA